MTGDQPKYVNLGAGDEPLPPPWHNYDLPDFDVTKRFWPFKNATVQRVNADCLLAHLAPPHNGERDGFDVFMNELARIMEPGGTFTFTAPDWRKPHEALTDVYHYRLIGPRTFYHYTIEAKHRPLGAKGLYFTDLKWKKRRDYLLQWSIRRNGEAWTC